MAQWHLLYTKPHKEPQVNRLLIERDIETFFSVVQLERGYGRGIRVEPFSPTIYLPGLMQGWATR